MDIPEGIWIKKKHRKGENKIVNGLAETHIDKPCANNQDLSTKNGMDICHLGR